MSHTTLLERATTPLALACGLALVLAAPGSAAGATEVPAAAPAPIDPPATPAAAPSPAAATYQCSVSFQLAPASAGATYQHDGATGGPVNPGVTVALADQARRAYGAAMGRMFSAVTNSGADLRATVEVGRATLREARGWRAGVSHEVVVTAADGREVGRWQVSGEGEVKGLDRSAITQAFDRAARAAAEAFEREFDGSAPVGAWLAARGLARRTPPSPRPSEPPPPRGARVGFVELGGGTVGAVIYGVRGGVSGRRLYGMARFERWQKDFAVGSANVSQPEPARMTVNLLGLEGGVLQRIGEAFEIRLGLGLHALSSMTTHREFDSPVGDPLTLHITKTALVGSVAGSATWVVRPFTRWKARGRVGAEVRLLAGTDLRFDAFETTTSAGKASLLVTVGGELPF